MIYLVVHIVLSSYFILCVKWLQGRADNVITVGALNYMTAALVGALLFFRSESSMLTWNSVLTGGINGLCYFVTFFFLIAAISWKGAANVAVITRLSILLPILYGVLVWGESPDGAQSAGIAVACVSLTLIGRRSTNLPTSRIPRQAIWVLPLFFVLAGSSRLSQEMFKYLCQPNEQPAFLFVAFSLAGLASIAMQLVRRKSPTRSEAAIGISLGLANIFQTFAVLKALEDLPGFIVFPVVSAGGLLFTTFVAVCFLKERLGRLSYAGIGLAICSLALLHPAR